MLQRTHKLKILISANSTSITYEDLVGNSHTNIGPIFDESVVTDNSASTTSSTVNDVDSEL